MPPGPRERQHLGQFADWERRCRQCRECLPEVIPAVQHLWEKSQSSRAAWLTYCGFETGRRIGELEIALRQRALMKALVQGALA